MESSTVEVTDESFLTDAKRIIADWYHFFLSKKGIILWVSLLGGISGILYGWLEKPLFRADLTFVCNNDPSSKINPYMGLASQLGIDLSAEESAFTGNNLTDVLKSRALIQKALLSEVKKGDNNILLINYLIQSGLWDIDWQKKPLLAHLIFHKDWREGDRNVDSVFKEITATFSKNFLTVEKTDRAVDIIRIRFEYKDEFLAKMFVEQLIRNAMEDYIHYKSDQSRQNLLILEKQVDSVKQKLSGNIADIARNNDLNVNPVRQIVKTGSQSKQVDLQANTILYGELLKNEELAKINLRKETPCIQVLDTPMRPLEKIRLGRIRGGLFFGAGSFCICLVFLWIRRVMN
jgi:uncharacterized protein involved in exopolysaccharide biosynthesis